MRDGPKPEAGDAAGVRENATLLNPVQRITAQRMLQSHLETARVSILGEADSDELVKLHRSLRDKLIDEELNLSFTHLFIKIIALALKKHPAVNTRLQGEELIYLDDINVGVAFSSPDGRLVVPVFSRADSMGIKEIVLQSNELKTRLQKGKITPRDMRGGTFTLTNLGMFPAVSWTTPLINPPQCAIMGVGCMQDRLYLDGQTPLSKKVTGLSLTHDHRFLNGYPAAAFFQEVVDMIADPWALDFGTN